MRGILTLTFCIATIFLNSLSFEEIECENESVWKKIGLKDVLIVDYLGVNNVSSPGQCAEICLSTASCRSFGISSIYIGSMQCFLYKHYVTNTSIQNTLREYFGLNYYWFQAGRCPVDFKYDDESNFCIQKISTPSNQATHISKCGFRGGHLAKVDDISKFDFIVSAYGVTTTTFIGGTSDQDRGEVRWFDGTNTTLMVPVDYGKLCVGVTQHRYEIVEVRCQEILPSFCEIPVHIR